VRFSQELSEDYQLVLHERGAASFVGTFDGHPYVAPFSGNIIELCPVGALTSRAYRFRARPWDIEGAGTVCATCSAQCNVELTVRDERVLRVLARDHEGVDDGWLCDKGRFSYQAVHSDERIVEPMVREGAELLPASWDKALAAAASALKKAGDRVSALAGGTTTNEEAFLLQQLLRDDLGSSHLSARSGGEQPLDVLRALADPKLQASVPDLEFAHTVLLVDCDPIDEAPVWDLRIRKGVRRRGTKVVVAGARPTALDSAADATLRFAPGGGEAFLVALDAALSGDEGNLGGAASAAGSNGSAIRAFADALRAAGEEVVIVYGERALTGQAGRALLNVAARLNVGSISGAGLLALPASPNGRGVREAGFAPGHGPGYTSVATPGRDAEGIAEGLASGDLHTVWLHHVDPLRTYPNRPLWEQALGTAQTVIAVESQMTDAIREYADVVFPAEAYPEKEGTLVHPDGRLQRLRPAIGRARGRGGQPGSGVRPLWQVITDLARTLGFATGEARTAAQVSRRLFEAVPFYEGLTLEEIGGRGVRWVERETFVSPDWEAAKLEIPDAAPAPGEGKLRLGTYRPLWAAKEVDVSPALHFIRARQIAELAPADADALGIRDGDRVEVGNGRRVAATAKLRASLPTGTVFLAEGTREDGANELTTGLVEIQRVGPGPIEATAIPAQVQPAVEGMAEMPPSAPQLPVPPRELS
jgi:NADH-quinone oxidoreductase subunit G